MEKFTNTLDNISLKIWCFRIFFLRENASDAYKKRSTLWNSVEQSEKAKNAQFARTIKADLPNDWSYELAGKVVAEFVKKTFVSKGMCDDIDIDNIKAKYYRNRVRYTY